MQGISICGSVASPHGANCRRACVARNDVRLPCEVNAVSQGLHSLHWWCAHKPQMKNNGRRMNAAVKTNARWLFGGDGRSNDARLERSESANEDILIFYFQMDLQTRIQVSSCLFILGYSTFFKTDEGCLLPMVRFYLFIYRYII
jgi:hypothetical protein